MTAAPKPTHTPRSSLPFLGIVRAGEVWRTIGRKGTLTLRLREDVDLSLDGFFEAEIVEGKARFFSQEFRAAQRAFGLGTQGSVMEFRTTLTSFYERIDAALGTGADDAG